MTQDQTVFYGMSVFLFFILLFVGTLIYIYRKNWHNPQLSIEDLFFLSIINSIDSELKTDNSATCNSFITQNCEDTTCWD